MEIRIAVLEDAEALLKIYKPYVEHTAITFEYDVPSVSEFRERIRHTLEKYPYLVAVDQGTIVGYTYVSAFKSRVAYDWSVETSIYVQEGIERKGIGRALYETLERILTKQHICNMCACISYPNPASEAFHESFGYKTVAHFSKSGFKQDAWCDMIWMEKELCPHTIPPKPFIPFPEIRDEYILN